MEEKKKRPRFEVRRGIQGSSDFRRVKSNRASMELGHKEFVSSDLCSNTVSAPKQTVKSSEKEPLPSQMVEVLVRGKWIKMQYSIVKAAEFPNWR
jgi:hypothetical protein